MAHSLILLAEGYTVLVMVLAVAHRVAYAYQPFAQLQIALVARLSVQLEGAM